MHWKVCSKNKFNLEFKISIVREFSTKLLTNETSRVAKVGIACIHQLANSLDILSTFVNGDMASF